MVAEIDVFLELFCFFDDPSDVGNLMSGSSAFSKTRLNIWKFTVHILLPEPTQTHVHLTRDAIQPSHPPLSPSPPIFSLPQHQSLFQ